MNSKVITLLLAMFSISLFGCNKPDTAPVAADAPADADQDTTKADADQDTTKADADQDATKADADQDTTATAQEPSQQETEKPPVIPSKPSSNKPSDGINAALKHIYLQTKDIAPLFDKCPGVSNNVLIIDFTYNCKGTITYLNVSDASPELFACIKGIFPERFDIDVTKDVCVCKDGNAHLTYSPEQGLSFEHRTPVGISNSNEYCNIYRFKKTPPMPTHRNKKPLKRAQFDSDH